MMVPATESFETELAQLGEAHSGLRLRSLAALAEMEVSLRHHGQLMPLLVHRTLEGLEVIDGHKRLEAARRLGWERIRTQACEVDAADAPWLIWHVNVGSGVSELEEAWIIRALYRVQQLSQVRIAELFARHKSWVSRRLLLAEGLSESLEADLRLGLVTPTAARELARLPRGNQSEVSQWAAQHGLSTRQLTRLVDRLLTATEPSEWQAALEAAAARPLRREACVRVRCKRPSATEQIVADVEALKRLAARLQTRLLSQPLGSLVEAKREVLLEVLDEGQRVALAVASCIERYKQDTEDKEAP
jgi:ParB-like chromosome segregation protein Spo0J